ncbi:hypothetical protein [Paenibacillus sp. FSL H8-0259]|nr:hypothetical protein [Paenibacillus sp. FSL H8-0259]OMF30948.1 hypothetical protein BK132_05830 [Paenibacillus sp. FSL H8-0259]
MHDKDYQQLVKQIGDRTNNDSGELLNIEGWGPWDYKDVSFDEKGPEIIIPSGSSMTGFIYFEHPGDALSNIRLIYNGDSGEHLTDDASQTYGGEIKTRLETRYNPDKKFVALNTRILFGYAMSDLQFIYVHSADGVYGARYPLGFIHPEWSANDSFLHLASAGWEIDGLQMAVHYGDAVCAIRVHTRRI